MASAVQQAAAPLWFQEKAANSDLPSNTLCQATFSSKENESNASASECLKGDTQSAAAPHLIMSEQVRTHYPKQQLELTCTDAPCTPAQSCTMQKVRPHDTPDSVNITPLSLGFMSDSCYKVDMSHSSEHNTGYRHDSYQNKSTRDQRMANYPQFSTMPSKNFASHNRIQLEVQQAGPEFHKENLLSLSLCKHEKQIQEVDLSVSSSHCVGNPPAQRVLATLKGPKLSPPIDNIQCGKLSPLVSWVSHGHLVNSLSLADPPCTSDTVRNSQGTVGKRSSKLFDSFPASEVLDTKHDKHKEESYKPINTQSSVSCTSMQLNFHKMIVPSGTSPQNIVLPFGRKLSSDTSLPLNSALSFVSPSQGGAVRCMQVPKVGVCDAERYQIHVERPVKRPKEGSAFKQVECNDKEVSPEKRPVEFLIGDVPSDREVQQPAKKKQTVLQQISNTLIGKEVTDTYAQPLTDLSMQQDHLERECLDRPINNSERICGCLEMETETADANTTLGEKLQLIATIQTSPERQFLELPKAAASDKHDALKLFAFPAYAKMPKALSTFSRGEPSLPLCSEMDRRLLEPVDDGKDLRCLGTTDADWGKFLALSATPTEKVAENAVNLLPYQQRFQRLQVFLKACNDFDQSNHMQALRSLSAAARSGYAVELETRAIRLSLEEGKEMHRVKLLNVLGKHAQRNQNDIGATPYGPRLPAPGANAALKHL